MTIAALFVQTDGIYYNIPDIVPWDIVKDARNYNGPWPVIAHSPCQLWGALAAVNYKRWGGEHNRPGNDGGCFKSALDSVQKYGGVLEHPAKTKAWNAYGLTKPVKNQWTFDGTGYTCEVWQSAYGHRANKATWLYYVGKNKPFDLIWDRPKGSHQIGQVNTLGRGKPSLSKKEANATPELFKDVLIKLAEWSKK